MNKRGQFYLVSAVVIIGLLIGFTTIANYSKKETYADIQNLQEEIGIEGNAVLEQMDYQGMGESTKLGRFEEFAETYYNNEEKQNLFFMFGNDDEISVIKYQELENEDIFVNGDDISTLADGTRNDYSSPANPTTITIGSDIYEFELTDSDEIHFIISQNIGGEKHVVAN